MGIRISTRQEYNSLRQAHWDKIALSQPAQTFFSSEYHHRLQQVYDLIISPGQRVLEIGCGRGDLLASLKPSLGVGVDFSPEMLAQARQRHPQLSFVEADAHELALDQTFDAIILSDLVNDIWDVQDVLTRVRAHCTADTRIIVNVYSRVHQPMLTAGAALNLANRLLPQNWLTPDDIRN